MITEFGKNSELYYFAFSFGVDLALALGGFFFNNLILLKYLRVIVERILFLNNISGFAISQRAGVCNHSDSQNSANRATPKT